MKNKNKYKYPVSYEVILKIKVKDSIDFGDKSFVDNCPHPSIVSQWIIDDLEKNFEDKGYMVVGFEKMTFINKSGK